LPLRVDPTKRKRKRKAVARPRTCSQEARDDGDGELLRVRALGLVVLVQPVRALQRALGCRAPPDDSVLVGWRKDEPAVVQLDLVRSALVGRKAGLGVEELDHGARGPPPAVALHAIAHLHGRSGCAQTADAPTAAASRHGWAARSCGWPAQLGRCQVGGPHLEP
jgi:hypothetical protein